MARDCDGVGDRLSFGSDAGVGDFVAKTAGAWVRVDVDAASCVLAKDRGGGGLQFRYNAGGALEFSQQWSGAAGAAWTSQAGDVATGGFHHVAVTYDAGAAANDPTFYVDGTAKTTTEVTAPSGGVSSEAARSLVAGENGAGTNDLDGLLGWMVYDDELWSAADINRARWWGTRGGSVAVFHPLVTDKLTNEGSATADGTATGTTVASLPRVERCWGAMMGVGR